MESKESISSEKKFFFFLSAGKCAVILFAKYTELFFFINLMLNVSVLCFEIFVFLLNISFGITWLYKWKEK